MNKKIPADKLLLVLSFGVLIISLIIVYNVYNKMKIDQRNEIITAKIVKSPVDCNQSNLYCNLMYNEKIYVLKTGKKFCNEVINKGEVNVLISKDKSRLIFIGEYSKDEYYSGIVLFLFSLYAIYRSIISIRLKE